MIGLMKQILLRCIGAFAGTLGYAFILNAPLITVMPASLTGLVGYLIYELLLNFTGVGVLFSYFIATVLISVACEFEARVMRMPSTIFLMTALVPLIPGGGLYYTMTNAISGDVIGFIERGLKTISLAVALALGVIVVTVMMNIINKVKKLPKRQ